MSKKADLELILAQADERYAEIEGHMDIHLLNLHRQYSQLETKLNNMHTDMQRRTRSLTSRVCEFEAADRLTEAAAAQLNEAIILLQRRVSKLEAPLTPKPWYRRGMFG